MKKTMTKAILILFCILLVASIGVSCAVAQDRHHLDHCCELDCAYCNIVKIAQKLIYKILISSFSIATIFIFYYVLEKIYNYNYMAMPKSLVFQSVQLNE